MLNILIMAGGRGERFWPKSRVQTPKQFLSLTGGGTMIQETVRRVEALTEPDHIFVATNGRYAPAIREQLPQLPADNIILEPEGRNTAPCIGLAALTIGRRDPEGVMAVLAADHVIAAPERFRELLAAAAATAADTGGVVTLGIQPDRPETGYGYIKMGQAVPTSPLVYRVERFIEKPDGQTAADFLADGRYLWNSGMFIWRLSTIRQLIAALMPELHQGLEVIDAAWSDPDFETVLAREFSRFEKISIDYGVMERAPEVYVIPAAIGWDDVGSWTSLERLGAADPQGNVLAGPNVTLVDSENCIFDTGGRLVAAIGLKDLIYVETEDAVLICPKHRAQDVKLILDKLRRTGKVAYL